MARTFIRQSTQVRPSDLYDDTVAAGAGLETQSSVEGDLNALRSQVKRILGEADWFSALSGRALAGLSTDLADLENKRLLKRTQVLTDVAVTAAQNWQILSVAGTQAPTAVAAVATTVNGAVVARSSLSGAGFNAHELTEIAGASTTNPKNLCLVRDSTTGQAIQSSGRDVYALVQYENTGVDGAAFNDTSSGNRVKLSFVRWNAGLNDLEAVPVGDIASKTINYQYASRFTFDTVAEDSFLAEGVWTDQTASVDVTLTNAIANQSGAAPVGQNIDVRITDALSWDFQTSDGLRTLLSIAPGATDTLSVDVDALDINTTNDVDFNNAISVDTAGTPIDIGVAAGTLATRAASDLIVRGAGELYLDDGNQTGSTWAQVSGIKLSDTQSEWNAFETAFGEASLLSAIVQASAGGITRSKTVARVTGAIAANVNVTGAGGSPNIDATLGNYSALSFTDDVDIFLNGSLMRNGANSAANHDVYPGTTPANGDLMFEFALSADDVIQMVTWS